MQNSFKTSLSLHWSQGLEDVSKLQGICAASAESGDEPWLQNASIKIVPDESIANFRKKPEKYLIVKAQTNSEISWLCESFCWTNPILAFVTAWNILMML